MSSTEKPSLRRSNIEATEPWIKKGFRLPCSEMSRFRKMLVDRRQSVQQFIEIAIDRALTEDRTGITQR